MNKKGQMLEIFVILGIAIFIILLTIFLTLFVSYKVEEYPIQITKDGTLIYDGIKSCVSVKSGGDTTTVTIHSGFLCIFPKQTITGRGIEIK